MKTKNSLHIMTLRIPSELDSLVTDAAYDARQSKTAWIRAAIRQRLGRRTEPSIQGTGKR